LQTTYRRAGHNVSALHVHLVFVTKYRRRVFNHAILTDCENFWTPSYFAVSAGGAPLAIITQYIENQARPL